MKTKCSFILKSTLSIVLAIMVLIGTVSTVVAATIEHADLGAGVELVETGAGVELVGTGDGETIYLRHGTGQAQANITSSDGTMTYADGVYYKQLTGTGGNQYFIFASADNSSNNLFNGKNGDSKISVSGTECTLTDSSTPVTQFISQENNSYYTLLICATNGNSFYLIYDPTAHTITAQDSLEGAGGGGGGGDPEPTADWTEVEDANLLKILNGTDISFYIESHAKEWVHLTNDSKQTPTYTRHNKLGTRWYKGYAQIAKSSLSTYPNITDNVGTWEGEYNAALVSTDPYPAGMHLIKAGSNNVAAVKSYTTIDDSYMNIETMSIVTYSDDTKTAFTENGDKVFDMTIKYYIFDGEDYYHLDDLDYAATTTNTTKTFDLTGLEAGTYTLITLAIDSGGYVLYITDTDTFTVTEEPKHSVTFSATTGGIISPSGSNDVGEFSTTSVSVSPNAGYDFTGWTIGSGITVASGTASGDSQTTTITVTTKASGDYTVTANFTAKPLYPITVTTNNAALGTASASPAYAYAGQTVTLTAVEDIGNFQYWDGRSGITLSNSNVTQGTIGTAGSAGSKTLKFTMPANAVNIKARFVEFSESSSDYYYNSYRSSDGKPESGAPYGRQMTNKKNNGNIYSYVYISNADRDQEHQLFTISKYSAAHSGLIYWQRPDSWGSHNRWSNDCEQRAVFFAEDGAIVVGYDWVNMSSDGDQHSGNTVFKTSVPWGAKYVSFYDNRDSEGIGKNHTIQIDLSAVGASHDEFWPTSSDPGSYGVSYGHGNSGYDGSSNPVPQGFEEYFNGDSDMDFTDDFDTDGFYTHNVGSHDYTKPAADLSSNQGYYILLLYKDHEYNINGVKDTVSKDTVIWTTELPGSTGDTVKIYAKDGTIRSGYKTFAEMADTKIYDSDNEEVGTNGGEYETYIAIPGETITIKTTINNRYGYDCDKHFCDEYYVRGFCVNGIVPSGTLNTTGKTDDNIYTLTYTIPENYEGDSIEITPIYYLTDTTNNQTVNFYVDNFTPEMQEIGNDKPNWGNTIYAYPFYSTMHSYNNAFGSYPGQPLVCYNGFYSIQIPIYDTSPFDIATGDDTLLTGATKSAKNTQRKSYRVSGITLHNGYYDTLHRTIVGYGSSEEKYQTQSFDYDDFYKIYHEKDGVDNIVFQFRYKPYTSGQDNKTLLDSFTVSDADSFVTKFGDDFEYLTNFHGRKVNIYGDAISGTALTKSPVYVVSKATVESTVGYYGTEWVIYVPTDKANPSTTTYTMVTDEGLDDSEGKSSIPPSLLLLNSSQSFSNSVYPSAVSGYNTSDWKAFYNALASYKDCPVMITYEHVKTTTGNATRSDGRWLYSSIGENITANIRVDVNTSNSGGTYENNATKAEPISGLSAVFTNAEARGLMTFATTIDPDESFNFTAITSNPEYVFEGWYLENGTLVSTDNVAFAERSGNYTFVARFRHHNAGILMLTHEREKVEGVYDGNGTTLISVTVLDTEGAVVSRTVDTANTVTLNESIIDSAHGDYTIKVSLSATPSGDDQLARVYLDNNGNVNITDTFFGGSLLYNSIPGEFVFNVSDLFSAESQIVRQLIYKSNFTAATYNYAIKYVYTGKLFNSSGRATQSFTKRGTLTPDESSYIIKDGENRILSPEFINNIAPCEENFGEITTWTIPDAAYRTFTADENNTYTLDMTAAGHTVNATQRAADQRTITFELPYFFDSAGAAKFNDTNARTDSAYAADEDPFKTVTKNYVLTVPYGKVPKPRYNTISSHYSQWQEVSEENDNLYVTAPETLLGATYTTSNTQTTDPSTGKTVTTTTVTYTPDDTVYHFQYWRIFSNKDGEEIARCYDKRFTFAALGDYTITPIYEVTQTQDPAAQGVSATINYLGASRNQWNGSDYGNASLITNSDAIVASDLIFEDFVCAYYYHGESIHDGITDATVTTGYVIDRIAQLDTFEDGKYNTGREYYKDKYTLSLNDAEDDIIGYISNPSSKPANISIIEIPRTSLNNKDRVQNYYSVYNSRGWDNGQPKSKYTYKKFVYRAFAYITVDGEVTLSDPVYFTMYDIATSQGGQK